MKHFMLVWAGLRRKRLRTIFTMISVVVAFVLFGLLQGINLGFLSAVSTLNADRLFTGGRHTFVEGMPVSLMNKIAAVPGVKAVTHLTYFGGYYQDRRNAIGVYAVVPETLFEIYNEFQIPKDQLDAMKRTRTGALITRQLAQQYGWKIGDKVPMGTTIWAKKSGGNDYQFDIVGIFDNPGNYVTGANSFYVNFDYFDEARAFGNGRVLYFISKIDDPRRGDALADAVDEVFANSRDETKTQTEQAFSASRLQQLADINFIVNSIVGAVLFTLLFLTGNTMMQSINERIPELAVLKTLGYTDGAVSAFVVVEALILCVTAALVGLAIAAAAFGGLSQAMGVAGGGRGIPLSVIVYGVALAILLAVLTALPPAWRVSRLKIVDALAKR